jgi:hypothetical protein
MTIFACEIVYFVTDVSYFTCLDRLVAFVAGHVYMLSVKHKSGPVMIKFTGYPVIKRMA